MPPQTPRPPDSKQKEKEKEHIAQSLLARAHSPITASTIYTEKIKSRPLYLKPTEGTPNTNAQQARRSERARKLSERKKKHKPAPISSRQKKALCIYDIPKAAQKYSIYEPLHRMWIGYIQEILALENERSLPITGAAAAKLTSADYHGAEMEVVRSGCVSRVGVKGIVVKDLRGVFEIITKNDKVKTLPKEGTIFKFCVPLPKKEGEQEREKKDLVFELHGDQFMYRAADRANRKFKAHFLPGL